MTAIPITLEEARFQANVLWRSRRLAAHGYRAEALTEDVIAVHSPRGEDYMVDLFARTCECPCWEARGYCKHLWGAVQLVEEQEREQRREQSERAVN